MTSNLSSELIDRLLREARSAAEFAYVPYSRFPVGACILTDTGEFVRGANIENASYGLTTCAERVAVHTAAARGVRTVVAVAVTAPRAAKASPCGACRQVLNEFKPVNSDLVVVLDGVDGPTLTTIEELLPVAFGPRDLEYSRE